MNFQEKPSLYFQSRNQNLFSTLIRNRDGFVLNIFDPGWVTDPGLKNFPRKRQFLKFLPFWVKKISSGWLKKTRIDPLFTGGQKYAQVR